MKVAYIQRPDSHLCRGCCHSQAVKPGSYLCYWSYTDDEEPVPERCPQGISFTHKPRKEVQSHAIHSNHQ